MKVIFLNAIAFISLHLNSHHDIFHIEVSIFNTPWIYIATCVRGPVYFWPRPYRKLHFNKFFAYNINNCVRPGQARPDQYPIHYVYVHVFGTLHKVSNFSKTIKWTSLKMVLTWPRNGVNSLWMMGKCELAYGSAYILYKPGHPKQKKEVAIRNQPMN